MGSCAVPEPADGPRRGRGARSRPRASSPRPFGWPGSSTTWATARSRTSSTITCCRASPPRSDVRRAGGKTLSHEDLSQRIIEDELGPLLRGLRRAPGAVAERDGFAAGETIDPAWVSFLISKPALSDPAMPRWVRWLAAAAVRRVHGRQPGLRPPRCLPHRCDGRAGGCRAAAALRVHLGSRPDALRAGPAGALEMFLTARSFMYQQVYFHRTVRAIDLDLAEVFGPSVRAIFGAESPADRLTGIRRPRRVRPAPPGRPLGPRRGHPAARGCRRHSGRRARVGVDRRGLAGDPAAPAELARGGRGSR